MTLMTDDIEWYPLPEVDDIYDATVDIASSQGPLSATDSCSSTTVSLRYLTPASSIGSFRSQPKSNPHLTGTVQPYLRRPQNGDSSPVTTESSTSQRSMLTAVSRSRGVPARQATLSLPRKNSSVTSFKTAKSASVPALKSTDGSQATRHSERSMPSPVTVTVGGSPGDQRSLDEAPSTESNSLPPPTEARDDRELNTTPPVASEQGPPTAACRHLPPPPTPSSAEEHSDSSTSSSELTTSTPATSHHKLAQSEPPPSVDLPTELAHRHHPAISPTKLNHLWTKFLANYLANKTGPHQLVSTASSRDRAPGVGVASSERRETGVQTTPSLALATASRRGDTRPPRLADPQPPPPQQLSQLTLQESLKTLRPDFVRRCQQRQMELRRNRELRSHGCCEQSHLPYSRPVTREGGKSQRSPHFILIDVTRNRPKMSPVEMYRNSKRYWGKLPEVKQKEQEQRRESEAATNRLHMKLYQQKVLERLRKQKK